MRPARSDAGAPAAVPPESTQQAVGYPSLFLLVLLGALVPVVPTGALVSSAAVVAFHQTAPFALLLVFVVASLRRVPRGHGAVLAGAARRRSKNGSRWLEALRARAAPERLAQAQQQARRPRGGGAGAVPAGAGGADPGDAGLSAGGDAAARGSPAANLPACLAWAATYQLIGMLGRLAVRASRGRAWWRRSG